MKKLIILALTASLHANLSHAQDVKTSQETDVYASYVENIRQSAEKGSATAQYTLAGCYYTGKGVEKDFKTAVKWYEKAAKQGVNDAQYDLAICYYKGIGIKQQLDKAVYWFRKAAEGGNIYAQYQLGVCYYNGKGIERNEALALEWLNKAAKAGSTAAINALNSIAEN